MRYRIFIIIAALVTYASLYPFHFTVPQPHAAAWLKLFTDWSLPTSGTHALRQIALFLPVGFAGAFAVVIRSGLPLRVAAISVVSFVAMARQAAQIYARERTASLSDVIRDTVGAVVGMAVGMFAGGHSRAPWQRWVASVALPSD